MLEDDTVLISYFQPFNSTPSKCLPLLKRMTETPRELIFIYARKDLVTDNSQKILHQFNLDFDRQILFINKKECKSRCKFFRYVSQIAKFQDQMDFVLFTCQQSILGNVLQSVHSVILQNNIPYLIRDSGSPTKINLDFRKSETPDKRLEDVSITIKKQMFLVDHLDPELIVNVFDIKVEILSINDVEIQSTVKFQWCLK